MLAGSGGGGASKQDTHLRWVYHGLSTGGGGQFQKVNAGPGPEMMDQPMRSMLWFKLNLLCTPVQNVILYRGVCPCCSTH